MTTAHTQYTVNKALKPGSVRKFMILRGFSFVAMARTPEEIAQCLLNFSDNFGGNAVPDEFQDLVNDFFTKPAEIESEDESDWEEEDELHEEEQ